MHMPLRPHDPQLWIDQLFSAKAAQSGGVVRRNKIWVAREIGRARFEDEVRKRGFHLIETTQQLVVICNPGYIRLVF
ncbi:N-(5'-phosphoribosyl)anthranilate isomerase [Yoonia sp.]|uniref:N-(5'-phosphoribosyl)anthranilate isomerase n=1 Tax=Yoonia sp. TaxID=2212373 RepID=UPI003F6C6CF6